MSLSWYCILGICLLYLTSAFFFWRDFFVPGQARRAAKAFLYAGFISGGGFFAFEAFRLGSFVPVASFYQAVFFFSWSMILVYALIATKISLDSLGVVFAPLVFLISTMALFLYEDQVYPEQYLHSRWFALHVLTAFVAYASFALSFVSALLYLVQNRTLKAKKGGNLYHKLPSLEVLETVAYRTIVLGFPLLSLALIAGSIWSKEAFGAFWRWDVKLILTTVTWLLYLIILYAHYISLVRGKKLVLLSILGFVIVLSTLASVS